MPIKYLDMFAGIGGFRSGLDLLGGFECIGSCEIDIYAKQAYLLQVIAPEYKAALFGKSGGR